MAMDKIDIVFEKAVEVTEAIKVLQGERQGYRDFLATADKAGILSDEQSAWVAENLPKRTRGPRTLTADTDDE